jgi:hypothetical protein
LIQPFTIVDTIPRGNVISKTYLLDETGINKIIQIGEENKGLREDTAIYKKMIQTFTTRVTSLEIQAQKDSTRCASRLELSDLKINLLQSDNKTWEHKYKNAVRFGRFAVILVGTFALTTVYLAMKQ